MRRLSGWLVERDDRIWLERGCPDHGLIRTMYDESPEILSYLEEWTAPTKVLTPDLRGNFLPVPAAYELACVGAGLSDSLHASGDAFFLLPQLLPLALSVFLLAFKHTRMAGAGLVMGVAIGAILMPGTCLALFGSGGLGR